MDIWPKDYWICGSRDQVMRKTCSRASKCAEGQSAAEVAAAFVRGKARGVTANS